MKNKFIVFTGPSAVGKATIENELFKDKSLKLCLSISATTRAPRKGEIEGKHYYFIDHDEFSKKIQNNEFVEWNAHFSHTYGTLKSEIQRIYDNGSIPFIEVDVVGAYNIIKATNKENIISFFITPPSIEELKKRIIERGTETSKQIKERLARVEEELEYQHIFDYVVVNDDLNKASTKIKKIIRGNK